MDLDFGEEKGYHTGLGGSGMIAMIGTNRHALSQGVNIVKCKIIPNSDI